MTRVVASLLAQTLAPITESADYQLHSQSSLGIQSNGEWVKEGVGAGRWCVVTVPSSAHTYTVTG